MWRHLTALELIQALSCSCAGKTPQSCRSSLSRKSRKKDWPSSTEMACMCRLLAAPNICMRTYTSWGVRNGNFQFSPPHLLKGWEFCSDVLPFFVHLMTQSVCWLQQALPKAAGAECQTDWLVRSSQQWQAVGHCRFDCRVFRCHSCSTQPRGLQLVARGTSFRVSTSSTQGGTSPGTAIYNVRNSNQLSRIRQCPER